MMFNLSSLLPALPEISMAIMIVVVLLAELFLGKKAAKASYYLTQATLVFVILAVIYSLGDRGIVIFNGLFIVDYLAVILKVAVLMLTGFALLYLNNDPYYQKLILSHYHVLLLISILGMMTLISANNFISLFVGLEMMSLPLYALIAMRASPAFEKKHGHLTADSASSGELQRRFSSIEAGLKYFILGSIASAVLLFGLSFIYGVTGSLDIATVHQSIIHISKSSEPLLLVALIFIMAGVLFKIGAAPFHMWLPDVYQGSPAPVTSIIAAVAKIAVFGLLVRLVTFGFAYSMVDWKLILVVVALLSMLIGNVSAIAQSNFRRLLAYSSVAHMGYLLLAISGDTHVGMSGAMFYMIVYAIMTLAAFSILVLLKQNGLEVHSISDLKGLNTRNPWLAFLMLLIMFSMAGVPPSGGFFAKAIVLISLVQAKQVWLAVVAMIFSIIALYYYLLVVKVMYFDKPNVETPIKIQGVDKRLAISVNGMIVLLLGLFPTGLFQLCLLAFQ